MNRMNFLVLVAITAGMVSCSRTASERYIDLGTGQEVKLIKDDATGLWVHADTKQPVYMYVDTKTNDTIYGKTGKVVNGEVIRLDDGTYKYKADYEVKVEVDNDNTGDGDYKRKVEKDGDIKIKTGDQKIKIDEDGKKVKND